MKAAQQTWQRRLQRGQSMVEYLVVATAMVLGMFFIEVKGKTSAQFMADMFRSFFKSLTYFLSLP